MVGESLYTSLRVLTGKTDDTRIVHPCYVVDVDATAYTAVVDVDGLGTRLTVPYIGDPPVADAAGMLLRSADRFYLLGNYAYTEPEPPPPEPEPEEPDQPDVPPPPPKTVTVALKPSRTGSTRPGQSTAPSGDRLVQGDWAGYGRAFGQAVYRTPNITGVSVTSCRVQLRRGSGGVFAAQTPTLHRMPNGSIVTAPTSQASVPGPALKVGDTSTFTLPADWGAALLSGTSKALGIWVAANSPYVVLDGLSTWAPSMTVTIVYQEDQT